MRPIDADALKDKLQQHHDFYVMAWGGFGKMPIGEKKRVDEITNCIAEVVNAPTIEPKTKVVAQVTFDEDKLREIVYEAVERFKEEYDIVDNPDAVSVVRCGACKHWQSDGGAMMVCEVFDAYRMEDDYCSCGEREGE